MLFVGRVQSVTVNNGTPISERDTRRSYEGISARS